MADSPIPGGGSVVDSHCHCGEQWYEPVESLKFEMEFSGVARAVLVQYYGQHDNSYQSSIIRSDPERFASVVRIDPEAPNWFEELDRELAEGARGIRLRPSERSAGADPFAMWRAAEERGTVVSCTTTVAEINTPEFEELLESVPTLRITVEHFGSYRFFPHFSGPMELDRDCVFALARFPNVYLKLGGIGEYSRRKATLGDGGVFNEPVLDYLRRAYDAFGASRVLWGSDYPPVSQREGYRNSLTMPIQEFSDLAPEELRLIFGGTAESLFFS